MRHEDKYICTNRQMELIRRRLSCFLRTDEHQTGDCYGIRSLYLDTFEDRLLNESLSGVPNRKKYRIRIYNCSDRRISLEEKSSIGNLKSKRSVAVDKEYVKKLLKNDISLPDSVTDLQSVNSSDECAKNTENDLLSTVCVLNRLEGLNPVVIVDYRRTAFVYDVGNVRITLDMDVGASTQPDGFFDPGIVTVPVFPQGKSLIEVKYDGILPGFVARLLDIGSLEHISFSKYALCRNVIENNGRKDEYYVI